MDVRFAVAVAAVIAFGAACTGDEPSPSPLPTSSSPATSSTPSTAPTPGSTPTPSPPAPPALARQDSPAGAEAFAVYYLLSQDYANRTGDTRLLRTLGRCKGCEKVAAGIERFYDEGGRVEGGALRVTDSDVVSHLPRKAALIAIMYDQAAGRLISRNGQKESAPAKVGNRVIATLARQSTSWMVANIQGLG